MGEINTMSNHVCIYVTGLSPQKQLARGEVPLACRDSFNPESFFSSEQLEQIRKVIEGIGWTDFVITGFKSL